MCDALLERDGDAETQIDYVYLYSADYVYDDDEPDIVTAGIMLVCTIASEGKYRVEHHSSTDEPDTFVYLEYDSFSEVEAKVREVLLSDASEDEDDDD